MKEKALFGWLGTVEMHGEEFMHLKFEHGSSLGVAFASWETELNIPEEGTTFEWDMVQENSTNEKGYMQKD